MPVAAVEDPILKARLAQREAPESPTIMYQHWRELLFLHWAVDPGLVAGSLPPGLTVDTFDGAAWIGAVPFFMRDVRPRFMPAVPGISNFQELNLRTYAIDEQGRPGVWFYSLDTTHRLANFIARRFFHLNYRLAEMAGDPDEETVRYRSRRAGGGANEPEQRFAWKRGGPVRRAEPGSLEFFLVERYRLFAYNAKRGRILTGRVHHEPYPIQDAEVFDASTRLFALNGLPVPERGPDSVIATEGVRVRIHPMERV